MTRAKYVHDEDVSPPGYYRHSGWIDPDGKVYAVDWAEHDRFAQKRLKRALVRNYKIAAAERLRQLGWISYSMQRGFMKDREPTQAQINVMDDICQEHSVIKGWDAE